jgi:hypothetical protein
LLVLLEALAKALLKEETVDMDGLVRVLGTRPDAVVA